MAQVKLSECILLIDGQIAKSEDVTDYIPGEMIYYTINCVCILYSSRIIKIRIFHIHISGLKSEKTSVILYFFGISVDERCPSNSIGSQCISCSILQQRDRKFCKSMKICEGKENFNTCYCQAGYEGIDCEAGIRNFIK